MAIGHGKKFPISLKSSKPSVLTPKALSAQLDAVGLNCSQLTPQFLDSCIANVSNQLPNGKVQSFEILAPIDSPTVAALRSAPTVRLSVPSGKNAPPWILVRVADSIWEPGYQAQGLNHYLAVIAFEEHFNYLYGDRHNTGFAGIKDSQPEKTRNCDNAQAIQDFFVEVCLSASATVVTGLDQTTMEAILTNVIQPLEHQNLSDYASENSRIIMLVDRYDSNTGYAEGVGVLQVKWHLRINDYKRKSKDGGDTHKTIMKVDSWSVLYSDTAPMCRDYMNVCKKYGVDMQICPPY